MPCVACPITVSRMLISIAQAASRLGWHRTTVWRKVRTDSSFPA
ncbi:MAG: hypothetical protein FGM42_11630, partial [Ilumatobacteraceae bacterium]|nr:hypothetical protein [Ilumatobacteraceae bacterium]